ncbi:MAG: hypothetical protein KAY24_00165 [Candidatus Eisenbacteria sp.]|nr:hypothetical protein [Candidatus Eisenbacteria bacterium]
MTPRIYDWHGEERDMAWLQSKYGSVTYLDAGDTTKFALVRVDETTGPAVLKVRVIDENGHPHFAQPIANHWPDNSLPLVSPMTKTLWECRACLKDTDGEGFAGFGLGSGSFIRDLEAGGPHTVWVLSPSLPSDGMSGIGMLGGTNHSGPLFLTFQIVPWVSPDPEPEPEPEPPSEVVALLRAILEELRFHQSGLRSIDQGIDRLVNHLGAA